jgi:FkbM family methyltransferase
MKRRYRTSILRRVARLLGGRFFHWAENNDFCDARKNGELWFINDRLGRHQFCAGERSWVVVDAGANFGDCSSRRFVAAQAVGCRLVVHAFQPFQDARARLQIRFTDAPWLQVVSFALGAERVWTRMRAPVDGSTLASLVPQPGASQSTRVVEKVKGTKLNAGDKLRRSYDLLRARGYRVAKLMPCGLDVRDYAPWAEHYHYANYVAVSAEARA